MKHYVIRNLYVRKYVAISIPEDENLQSIGLDSAWGIVFQHDHHDAAIIRAEEMNSLNEGFEALSASIIRAKDQVRK